MLKNVKKKNITTSHFAIMLRDMNIHDHFICAWWMWMHAWNGLPEEFVNGKSIFEVARHKS